MRKKDEIHLNIYPTKYNCKMIFFKQNKNKIEILSEIDKNIPMDNRIFMERSAREKYIDQISSCISNEELKYGKCDSVFINIQENDVILKNIKIDPEIKKKDIIKAIDIEIKEFFINSFNDYCIDYKKLYYNDNGNTEAQVVLFPKKYIDLFEKVCDCIGIEKRAMHTNFNLIERIIKKNGIDNISHIEGEFGIVEFRKNDLVISVFLEETLKNSYVIKKDEFTQEIGRSILENCGSILVFGEKSIEDLSLIEEFSEIIELDIDCPIEYTKNGEIVSAGKYFNITGKRLN